MPKVVIDPGHGGHDSGAVGNGVKESALVLSIGRRVRDLLKPHAEVLMTRESDHFVSLSARCHMANDADCDIFVSLHANSAINTDAQGVETFTSGSDASRKLATFILNRHLEAVEQKSRGVKKANFYVIRNTRMPAVLHEFGFVSNVGEAAILDNTANQEKMARALADGVLDYFGINSENGGEPLTLEQRLVRIENHLGLE